MDVPDQYLGTAYDFLERLSGKKASEWKVKFDGSIGKPIGTAFRETKECTVQVPALPLPTLAGLRRTFDWIKGLPINDSPTGPVTLRLGTVLRTEESSIDGAEYTRRRIGLPALGYPQGQWLVDNQDRPELSAFKALAGKFYIDLPDTVVVDEDGDRYFASLDGVGERWYLYWHGADYGLDQFGRLALGK